MKNKPLVILSILFLLNISSTHAQKKPVTQGIKGQVTWLQGNFMPTFGAGASQPKGSPAVREIYIHALTPERQTEQAEEPGFYKKINTPLIKKLKSDKNGRFTVALPVGYYSIFTKEEKGFYANLFDDAMNINPVQVKRGKWSKAEVKIDYAAVF
ncbi:MAG: carboxypeptidase regulatory-like domain-containing protein [Runella sp.]